MRHVGVLGRPIQPSNARKRTWLAGCASDGLCSIYNHTRTCGIKLANAHQLGTVRATSVSCNSCFSSSTYAHLYGCPLVIVLCMPSHLRAIVANITSPILWRAGVAPLACIRVRKHCFLTLHISAVCCLSMLLAACRVVEGSMAFNASPKVMVRLLVSAAVRTQSSTNVGCSLHTNIVKYWISAAGCRRSSIFTG